MTSPRSPHTGPDAGRMPPVRREPDAWPRWPRRAGMRGVALLAVLVLLAGALGGCNGLFFQPNRIRYYLPEQFGLQSEDVFFPSGDGTPLTGWFLPAQGRARGTVVYFHGNAANISNHVAMVRWLPPAGYAVFIFDYRGYGVSGGEPDRAGVIRDGVAAIQLVRDRPDVDPERLVIFGQSLGGAIAVSALAEAGTQGVRALLLEGAFASYRQAARTLMNEHWFTWPFQYPVAWLFISDDHAPEDAARQLAGLPVLVIHGTADATVPLANGKTLFAAFPGPDKTFWELGGVGHVRALLSERSPWRKPVLEWLDERLGPLPER